MNELAASPFVALVVTMTATVWLARLYAAERKEHREDNARQWGIVSEQIGVTKDTNAILRGALDAVERLRG